MKEFIKQLRTEDWTIVLVGAIILALSIIFPELMPRMPKTFDSLESWKSIGLLLVTLYVITVVAYLIIGRSLKGLTLSFIVIFLLSVLSHAIAAIPIVKEYGFESVFFAVIIGLLISNIGHTPEWLKPAIQSEFFIKIGIVCLGSTILVGTIIQQGVFGLIQALIVVFTVWYFAYWVSKKFGVDDEMGTLLASSVSICGVSAAIATCGVIKGDNKKLSYVISLVLVVAVPMMYLMPWLSNLLGLSPQVAGAWLGGTIDTTGAVAASGTLLGEEAAQTAIIVKSSQNVLLGVAAFIISLMWTYKDMSAKKGERPTLAIIWDRFPKFVVGFVLASLFFSFALDADTAKAASKVTKGYQNALFSIAFICIGLETRFRDVFSKENNKPLKAFLTAQTFNIIVTLIVALLVFGLLYTSLK